MESADHLDRNRRLAQMGQSADAQLNEIYAKKYEESARLARERMLALETQLNSAATQEQKDSILSQIAEERAHIEAISSEVDHRRE
jgi:hypothetical protein